MPYAVLYIYLMFHRLARGSRFYGLRAAARTTGTAHGRGGGGRRGWWSGVK